MNQILVTISLLIVATCVKAQGVEGIVFDENREPIPFASVSVIAVEDSAYVTITVVGTSKTDDKSYITLRLSDLRFDAIDHSCIYTLNGLVEYEIWNTQYE